MSGVERVPRQSSCPAVGHIPSVSTAQPRRPLCVPCSSRRVKTLKEAQFLFDGEPLLACRPGATRFEACAARVVSLAVPSCELVDIFCLVAPESSGRRRRPANSKWSIQSNLRSENTDHCELLECRKLLADAWLFFSQHISRGSRFRRVNKSESASLSSLSQKCSNSSWRNDETCPFLWQNAVNWVQFLLYGVKNTVSWIKEFLQTWN